MINFTDNEIAILQASRDNEFDDATTGGTPWTSAVIDGSGLDPRIARGAISSLVQKGVVTISEYDKDDTVFSVNQDVIEIVEAAI